MTPEFREAARTAPRFRRMVDHDLAMLHAWLQRPHVKRWWAGDDRLDTLDDTRAKYAPRLLEHASVTPWIAELDGRPIGFIQSYVAMGSGDGWWEDETDPGVRGIDQFLADEATLGQGLGTRMVQSFVQQLFADPQVTRIQTDPDPANARAIRCYRKAGFIEQGLVTTPDGPALLMVLDRPA